MQWDREISKHIDNKVAGFRVKVFYGLRPDQGGASNWGLKDDLAQADIVLTTYTEVQKSYPRAKLPEDLQTLEEKKAWWLKTWTEERGVLHQIHFYRVVLDEAQAIKNHKGITSVACRGLMAKHRWAMSGTPILNDLGELYPYFKFLRVKNSGSFRTFKQNFCIDGQICMKRLHSFLNGIMIRRTYKTELFHHPIVQLPENHEETIELEFNDLERTIYNTIEERFRRAIARAAAAGDLEKQQRLVLFMLTRLRQLTTHVFMLQETMERMYDLEDADSLYEVMKEARAETTSPADMARSICTMISHKDDSPIRTPPEATPEIEDDDFENAEIEKTTVSRFDKYLRTLVAQMGIDEMNKRTLCQKCQSTPTNPYVTSCMHVYCMECLDTLIVEYAQQDSNEALCVKCNMAFQDTEPCIGLEEMKAGIKPPRQKPKPQLNEIGRPRRKPNDNMKWVEADGKLLQSTKTAAAEAKIEQWLNADSTCKIIVFGQFHMVLKLFAKLCERRNWSHCSYHGKMSQKVRDENLSRFKTDPLNITEASKVIVVDLWFNTCVEQQAFCRVYRIGQTAETHLTRFVVKDTIDEKLISMQQRKDKIISAAMDDRTVMKNLGLKDMLHLFGQDVTYFHGEEDFVYSDDEDGEEDPIAWDPCMPIGEI
ncbi:uncharacterized protein KY384_007533 [Bacidia gigantensis]|uniref:uncharacterized protein n=1 Tax=Bacidia gigantensis TaxID=2732470 RepID=UPI001D050C8E|nr:uncharacterized protein KY384_007533 [Bacidia gigantensis]KAG8527381.1 hypothetical protein KY384_007533 [Bacidia gigantensis]